MINNIFKNQQSATLTPTPLPAALTPSTAFPASASPSSSTAIPAVLTPLTVMPTSQGMLSTPSQLTTMTTSMSCTTSTVSKQSTDSSVNVHQWKSNEEDMLVSIRHERSNDFNKVKNHSALWDRLAHEINEILNTCITGTQAFNKYNSLKRRWKEVIDSENKTGSEPKTFRQRVAFDMHYGTKSSTRPKFTMDSSRKEVEQEEEIPNQSKKSSKSKKRKSEILGVMETNHNDLNETMKCFHNEKMQRYDRLLDLYERELDIKQNKTS